MLIRNAYTPGPRQLPAEAIKPIVRTRGEQLLAEIEGFLRRHPRMSRCAFGKQALRNPALIKRLEEGLDPQEITCARVRRFIESYEA